MIGVDEYAQVLTRMRLLLSDQHQWTRGAMARTVLGRSVAPLSDDACSWSLCGAAARSLLDVCGPHTAQCDWRTAYDATLVTLWQVLPPRFRRSERHAVAVDAFNDHPDITHRDVLQLLNCAANTLSS